MAQRIKLKQLIENLAEKWIFPVRQWRLPVAELGIIFLLFSGIALSSSWRIIRPVFFIAPNEWKTTPGIIVSSSQRTIGVRYSDTFAEIWYAYRVDERQYQSRNVNFAINSSNWNETGTMEAYLAKYPVGKRVTVYYLPYEPDFSALEPFNQEKTALLWPPLFFVIGFGLCCLSIKIKKAQMRATPLEL